MLWQQKSSRWESNMRSTCIMPDATSCWHFLPKVLSMDTATHSGYSRPVADPYRYLTLGHLTLGAL